MVCVRLDLRLEDERFWSLVFAAGATCLAAVVAVDSANSALLVIAATAVAVGVYVLRALIPRIPAWVVLVGAIASLTIDATGEAATSSNLFILLAAFYVAFRTHSTILALVTLIVGLAAQLILGTTADLYANNDWLYWATAFSLTALFGRVAYQTRLLATELELTRAQVVDQAVIEERRRIAHDVHDIVGHSLTAVLLHVGGARRLVNNNPTKAEIVLGQAEEIGRRSMADVRQAVSLLRGVEASAEPVPGLVDLEALVAQHRKSGLDAHLELDADIGALDASLSLTAYRIAAEALTNVAKHASDATVNVAVTVDSNECRVVVANGGGRPRQKPGTEFGLIGMSERAKSVGGHLRRLAG